MEAVIAKARVLVEARARILTRIASAAARAGRDADAVTLIAVSKTVPASRLRAVPGRPLSAFEVPEGCAFAPRCDRVTDTCRVAHPQLVTFSGGQARCVLLEAKVGING